MTDSAESKVKKFFVDSVIYGLGNVLNHFILFVLLYFYVRILSRSDLGVVDLVTVSFALISEFIITGAGYATFVFYYREKNGENKRSLLFTSLVTQLSISILASSGLFLRSKAISQLILKSDDYSLIIAIASLTIPFTVITTFAQKYFQIMGKRYKFTLFINSNTLLTIILNIILVIIFKIGIKGIFLSLLISNALFSLIGLYLIHKAFTFRFSTDFCIKIIKASTPMLFGTAGAWIASYIDRIFIVNMLSLDDNGLYAVAFRFVVPITFLMQALSQAQSYFFLSQQFEKESRQHFANVFGYTYALITSVALVIALFSRELLQLITTPEYYSAVNIIGLLLLATIFYAGYNYVSCALELALKFKYISFIMVIASGLNCLLNYLLLPIVGVIGAAIATLATNFLIFFMSYVFSQKFYPIPYKTKDIFLSTFAFILLGFFGYFLKLEYWFINILLKFLLIGLFIFYLFYFKILKKDEIITLIRSAFINLKLIRD
jgi:O-antigen/teichoic acid export membrane protein